MRKIWRLWAKALGEKSGQNNKEADKVAMIRTVMFLIAVLYGFITNTVIMMGVIHQW